MATINSLSYKIYSGKSVFGELKKFLKAQKYSACFILCDENTFQHCLPLLIRSCKELKSTEVFEIESGEGSKSLEVCGHIWEALLGNKADRRSLLINLGGGVVSDLGGFVASTYKRGVDFINIPTSLLAMADASVGGKTGIDHVGLKNVIGSFAQPKAVFVFPDFLKTLDSRQVYNGLAEIYKIALVSDRLFWNKLADAATIRKNDRDAIINKSIDLKNKIVKKDPHEKDLRKILNFGHSIGHAIEAAMLTTDRPLLHGEAIVAGMIAESFLAHKKKLISEATLMQVIVTLKTVFDPQPFSKEYEAAILHALANDKKNAKDKLLFSLINGIGKCKTGVPVKEKEAAEAIGFYLSFSAAV